MSIVYSHSDSVYSYTAYSISMSIVTANLLTITNK